MLVRTSIRDQEKELISGKLSMNAFYTKDFVGESSWEPATWKMFLQEWVIL
jgi:hypothetical protein